MKIENIQAATQINTKTQHEKKESLIDTFYKIVAQELQDKNKKDEDEEEKLATLKKKEKLEKKQNAPVQPYANKVENPAAQTINKNQKKADLGDNKLNLSVVLQSMFNKKHNKEDEFLVQNQHE